MAVNWVLVRGSRQTIHLAILQPAVTRCRLCQRQSSRTTLLFLASHDITRCCPLLSAGAERKNYFDKVVAAPDASFTAGQFNFGGMKHGQAWLALVRI